MSKLVVAVYAVFICLVLLTIALWPSSLEERHHRELRAAHAYGPTELWGCIRTAESPAGGYVLEVAGPAGGAMATGGGGVAHSRVTDGPSTPDAPDVAGSSAALEVMHSYTLNAPASLPLGRHVNHVVDVTGTLEGETAEMPAFDVQTMAMISAGCTGA